MMAYIGAVGGRKHRPLASTCLRRCFLKLVITANTSLFSASIYPMEGFFGAIAGVGVGSAVLLKYSRQIV